VEKQMVAEGVKGSRNWAFKEMKGMNAPWRSVLYLARRFAWAKGHEVQFRNRLYFLEKGRVRLTHQSLEGMEKILWYIHEGCIFGETPFLDPMPLESFFTCATDCVVYGFSKESFDVISRERPDLVSNLLLSMSRKLRILSNQASSLYVDNLLVRVCKFMAQHLEPDSHPLTANLGISRQEMASLLGVHRVSLYKVLKQQEEEGLFGPFEGNAVVILQPEEFFRLASA